MTYTQIHHPSASVLPAVLVLLLLSVTSCLKTEPLTGPAGDVGAESLRARFSVVQEPFRIAPSTRAGVLTSLSYFFACPSSSVDGVTTYMARNMTFAKDYSSGDYVGDFFWPDEVSGLQWRFDCSNSPMTVGSDGITIEATNTFDTVVATCYPAVPKTVNTLEFRHIFALIDDVIVTADEDWIISGAEITLTPRTAGTYNIAEGDGKDDGTGWSDIVEGVPLNIAPSSAGTFHPGLLLVPGRYSVTAQWTARNGADVRNITDMITEVDFRAGVNNVVSITLGGEIESVVL